MPPSCFDDVGLNLKVLQQEIGRPSAVGLDSSNGCSSQHHNCGFVGLEPIIDSSCIKQVEVLSWMGSGVLHFELIVHNRLVLGLEQWLHQPYRAHPLQKCDR
jgi:hypothetical protein